MSSYKVDLADGIVAAVTAALPSYVVPTATAERAWAPHTSRVIIEAAPPNLWVLPMNNDTFPSQTRTSLSRTEIPIQTGLQSTFESHQVLAEIDLLVELEEQMSDTIRKLDLDGYSWIRSEALRDENGLPFDFTKIRDENTYECYKVHYFNYVLQP